MEDEIRKLIAADRLTTAAGAALGKLPPGGFCFHRSWGVGRITAYNFLLGEVGVDFRGRRGHTMQLQYAAESLQPLPATHIWARVATDAAAVKVAATADPAGFVRGLLADFGGSATADQLTVALVPAVFAEAEFKPWWAAAKKALRHDTHVGLPAKKSEPIILRARPVARAEELLAAFRAARAAKDQVAALDHILREPEAFTDHRAELQAVAAACNEAAARCRKLDAARAVELLLARDELCAQMAAPAAEPERPALPAVARLLREEEAHLPKILGGLAAGKLRRAVAALPAAFGDGWPRPAIAALFRADSKTVPELARALERHGHLEALRRELDRAIRDHAIPSPVLHWLCKERRGPLADLVTPTLFAAILNALEHDQLRKQRRASRLQDLLLDDRELVGDLLEMAEPDTARDALRRLMLSPAFDELTKRSLLARVVRAHPELEALLGGGGGDKEETLIVSWDSLARRQAEYEELVNKRIPENTRDIATARSYGDLRENFEFKSAKEMQRVLLRRKAEMERDLARARGSAFDHPDLSRVSIGTAVTIRDPGAAATTTYTILGAWDSDPAAHVISYLTPVAQSLLGHAVGETVDLDTGHGLHPVEILAIAPCPPRAAPASAPA